MREHRIDWKNLMPFLAWLLSLAVYAALYGYACVLHGEWTTGFAVTTLYYFMPSGLLFGLLFGAKEGRFWNLKWLLPVFYYVLFGILFSVWKLYIWWLAPSGLALLGLLLSFSVYKFRKSRGVALPDSQG